MPLRRRSLLTLAGSALLNGCGPSPDQPSVLTLRGSLPGSLLRTFQQQSRLSLRLLDNRPDLWERLQQPPPRSWFGRPDRAPIASLLGSDWLDRAIARNRIQPLRDPGQPWQWLDPRWQQAAQRGGRIWGIPWRWGLTAIAYNRNHIPDPIADWADLWRPELRGRLTLPDHPREVIGLTLKKLGLSYNTPLAQAPPQLAAELATLHRQVKAYTSDAYQEMLRIADSWVAVGWTEDLFELSRNFPEFTVIIPSSGSSVWWDLWVIPAGSDDPGTAQPWIEFVLNPAHQPRILNGSRVASVLPVDPAQLDPSLRGRADLQADAWAKAEIWQPLPKPEALDYLRLWQQMRAS